MAETGGGLKGWLLSQCVNRKPICLVVCPPRLPTVFHHLSLNNHVVKQPPIRTVWWCLKNRNLYITIKRVNHRGSVPLIKSTRMKNNVGWKKVPRHVRGSRYSPFAIWRSQGAPQPWLHPRVTTHFYHRCYFFFLRHLIATITSFMPIFYHSNCLFQIGHPICYFNSRIKIAVTFFHSKSN